MKSGIGQLIRNSISHQKNDKKANGSPLRATTLRNNSEWQASPIMQDRSLETPNAGGNQLQAFPSNSSLIESSKEKGSPDQEEEIAILKSNLTPNAFELVKSVLTVSFEEDYRGPDYV